MSSVASIQQNQAFSSGVNIFKIKSLTPSKKWKEFDVEINLDEFLKIEERNSLEPSSSSSEDQALRKLFNLPQSQSFTNVSESSKNIENIFNSDLSKQEGGSTKQTIFYAAVPRTNKCLVCKETFENYFQHISTVSHKKQQKTYITTSLKLKVSLDEVITNLISSISKQGMKNSTKQGLEAPEKRQRVSENTDLSELDSQPRKRKMLENHTPMCVSSLQSTSLITSNCFTRKESFFE